MTAKQVKEVEEIALDIVKKGLPVHAKECSLSLAKEIQGLRAVFDEVCLCTHVCVCVCVCVCWMSCHFLQTWYWFVLYNSIGRFILTQFEF